MLAPGSGGNAGTRAGRGRDNLLTLELVFAAVEAAASGAAASLVRLAQELHDVVITILYRRDFRQLGLWRQGR